MIARETLDKIKSAIRRIEITTRKVVNESLAGQYHSIFKGKGMEFDAVREYTPGDEIRSIDWNVTARSGKPFTKQFAEERELTVVMLVDSSASMNFGTTGEFKNELAAVLCALLAFSAIKNNDRVGLVSFSDDLELHIPARKGRRHALRLVRDVLFHQPRRSGSDLKKAIEFVSRTQKKRAIVFVISDFFDEGFQRSMQILERTHDVVAIQLTDPREEALTNLGLVRLRDPESGEIFVADTASRRWRQEFATTRRHQQERLERFFTVNGIDHLTIRTDQPYETELVAFFRRRAAGGRR